MVLRNRAVISLALDKRTWRRVGWDDGGLIRISGGHIDEFHAVEFGAEQQCCLWRFSRRRERVESPQPPAPAPEPAHQPMVAL